MNSTNIYKYECMIYIDTTVILLELYLYQARISGIKAVKLLDDPIMSMFLVH